ncbi:MAG: TonB-dependent receptor [Pseudomonadota bacterium]
MAPTKFNGRKLTRAMLSAMIAGITVSANAQPQDDAPLEEIRVTGTRIKQTDGMVTPVPITTVTTAELASFEPGGTVAEQLDALPQFFNTATAQRGGGGSIVAGTSGGSYLDMRSLGAQRTLVLFDGSRMMPADKRGSVNVDIFPTALIRSIDVVTGGASAAYGADALGGVTNFILDREFQGLKMELGTGVTEVGDGERWNFSVAGGKQIGDRLNVIGSVEARHINQIQRNPEDLDEDWFQRWGHVTNPAWYPGAPKGIPQRLTLPWVSSTDSSPTGIIWARQRSSPSPTPLIPFRYNGQTFLEDGSATRNFIRGDVYADPLRSGSTLTQSGGPEGQIHNSAFDAGTAGNEVVGRSGFGALQYKFSDSLTGFAQVMIGRSESNFTRMRGDAYLSDGKHATVFRNNAYLPADIGKAMDEAGIDSFQLSKLGSILGTTDIGRGSDNRAVFSTYSWNVGFDAVLPNGWDLRASWQSGESDKRTGIYDEVRIDRVFLSMDAVRDPKTGAIVCNVQLYNPTEAQLAQSIAHLGLQSSSGGPLMSPVGLDNTIRDCIPHNVMGAGNMSQAAADYMVTPIIGESVVKQDFAEMLLTGELFEGWNGPISFAGGLTYRDQSFSDHALPEDIDALGPPQNAPNIGIRGFPIRYYAALDTLHKFSSVPTARGDYDVWEWFSEINVPVWEAASGEQRVDTSVAYRSSDYSSVGRVESWKLGVDFQLLEDLRFRVSKSRDVREASFSERFDKQNGGASVTDPSKGNAVFTTVVIAGGNPNLRPEKADTVVAGFIYEPRWLEGLRLSTDWYEVKIADAVSTLGAQRIVDECEINKVQELCAQIERKTDDKSISTIYNVFLNVAQAKVEGVDTEIAYRMEPDFVGDYAEAIDFRLLAGYVIERSDTPLGGVPFDIAGQLATPDLTGTATLRYDIGAWNVQLQQRYTADTIRNMRWVEGVDVDINTVDSANYTNFRLGYDGELSNGARYRLGFNVTNMFDRDPPIIASSSPYGASQTIHNDYDSYGRRYQLSLNMDF